ncbi:hypothetical protein [Paraburkholderia sp. J63]|uniref:hypothetical protein n=1 Tax=Paraburkholderia sp. J63 TaxID=2805434 RepID=UPI002ABD2745|nr:hypothetical protein [Paraburkholderia sp. J63]
MELPEEDLAAITLLLSSERLGTFCSLAGSARSAVALHQQTLQVAGTLMSVTAVVEIALRNTICDRLASHFETDGWLRKPPRPFVWREQEKTRIGEAVASAQRATYAKMDAAQRRALDERMFRNGVPPHFSYEQHVKARQRAIAVPNGQVIAQLTLFFWKRLFSAEYEQSLWRPALKRVFPDKALRRADVAVQLERIYQTRNRIAHHEPVYGHRLRDAMAAIDFVISKLGSARPGEMTPLGQLLKGERRLLSEQATALQMRLDALSARNFG